MNRRNRLYLLAALTSIALYATGVFTGAFILGYSESRTSEEFARLNQEIDSFGSDLQSIEMEQLYLATGKGELGCKLIVASLNNVQEDLDYFWKTLPEKLEVYETSNPTDSEYERLKADYMAVSLKAWLLSLSVKDKCGQDMVPILYFYTADCAECIEQGYALDQARSLGSVMVYTIDLNLPSETVSMIKEAYGIESAPALIIGEDAYEGFVSFDRLSKIIEGRLA
jgi:hypothetical protein